MGKIAMFKSSLILLMVMAAFLPSCGYTLSRNGSPAGPAKGAYKVFVPMFTNDAYEPEVEKELTTAFKDEIAQDGRWVLTDAGDADLALSGRVTLFQLLPLSYDSQERVLEYRVLIMAEVKLTDLKTNKVLWKDPAMQAFADYRVTEDITKSKIMKGEAVKKASKYFAEEFIIKALDTF